MNIVKLSETVAVSAQVSLEDVAAIATAGYKVLINNRPDGEERGQPANADVAAAAEAAGLEYHYMPITALDFPGPDFKQMRQLLDDPAKPVLAFCRTGTRCTNLWVASRAVEAQPGAAEQARQLGYDLGMVARLT